MSSTKGITKKVINSPEKCVDDNLRGVVALYPCLKLHPKNRVVTLRRKEDSKRVAILSGGGSGHEPFASGFVGAGMLDGAVAGGVFASPPAGHVLYAITQVSKYNSGGVLVIIGNYTGDRLNFGKAIEKAKIAGIKVEGLIVGEDVASSMNKTGGRGMVGDAVFFKLCGALSAKGYDLEGIRKMGAEANKYMGTLGVCLSACSLPGQPPLFEIANDEMELGAGVHGEAGIAKVKMGTAKQIVKMILDQIIDYLKLVAGNRVAVVLSNLGSTSIMEMNIISAETKDYLESKKITVERIFSGYLKASLDMHGFQICLLHLNKEHGDLWLKLLDYPTGAPGWVGGDFSKKVDDEENLDDDTLLQSDGRKTASGPSLSKEHQETFRGALVHAAEQLIKSENLLNKLDSGCGDGDCGNTLKKFGLAILSYLEKASLQYISNVLWDLAEIAEKDMGGTSGGIYSLGLSAASQAIAAAKLNDPKTWLSAWHAAMDAITKYGGAEPGDRTMMGQHLTTEIPMVSNAVLIWSALAKMKLGRHFMLYVATRTSNLDTLYVAAVAFEKNLLQELKENLLKTAEAAEQGAKSTASMVAKAGRASYVASGYTNDEDAGARAVAIWLHAILHFIAKTL